jgi:hypothetical protein
MEIAYEIKYNCKGSRSDNKVIAFGETVNQALCAFMNDWVTDYNKSVADDEFLVTSPDELERISIEPVCLAKDVINR